MKHRWMLVCLFCLAGCNLSTDPTPDLRPAVAATKTLSGVSAEFMSDITPTSPDSQSSPVAQTPRPTATQRPQATLTPTVSCVLPNEWEEYTVKRGDTVSTIAKRSNSTIESLVKANCLINPNALKVGQVLRIPPLRATATPSPASTEDAEAD